MYVNRRAIIQYILISLYILHKYISTIDFPYYKFNTVFYTSAISSKSNT